MSKHLKEKKKKEFSKVLLIQESVLIWLITFGFFVLAYICIKNEFLGELPWLTAMASLPWTVYGVSQAAYYRKATKENTQGGLKFETVMNEVNAAADTPISTEEQNGNYEE